VCDARTAQDTAFVESAGRVAVTPLDDVQCVATCKTTSSSKQAMCGSYFFLQGEMQQGGQRLAVRRRGWSCYTPCALLVGGREKAASLIEHRPQGAEHRDWCP
jgi:hypothetical protein